MSMTGLWVGFGDPDDSLNFARFGVEIQGNEDVYPDWTGGKPKMSTRGIAGSSNIVTQIGGHEPAFLTLRIWFDDRATYQRFRRYWGTKQTLSLLAGFTSYDGERRWDAGREYERFHGAMLEDIDNVQNRIGGGVECTARWMIPGVAGATW